jgi:hypothetical protein
VAGERARHINPNQQVEPKVNQSRPTVEERSKDEIKSREIMIKVIDVAVPCTSLSLPSRSFCRPLVAEYGIMLLGVVGIGLDVTSLACSMA